MRRVHTLRIIFGHPNINDALLRSFFDKDRERDNPLRKLWLETSRISAGCCLRISDHPLGLPLELDFTGLESIRLRRLPLRPGLPSTFAESYGFVHARGGETSEDMQDGAGGRYLASTNPCLDEYYLSMSEESLAETDMYEHLTPVALMRFQFKLIIDTK